MGGAAMQTAQVEWSPVPPLAGGVLKRGGGALNGGGAAMQTGPAERSPALPLIRFAPLLLRGSEPPIGFEGGGRGGANRIWGRRAIN